MDALALVLRAVLIAVFGVSAIAKLADREGTRAAIVGFGLSERGARSGAIALPAAEIGAAVLLAIPATAVVGAVAALVLLVVFIAGILVNLARGRRPDCHCFGQIHSAPIGWTTVARNVLLGLAAVVVVAKGNEAGWSDAFDWTGDVTSGGLAVAVVVLTLIALGQAWLSLRLFRDNERLRLKLDELDTRVGSGGGVHEKHGLPVGEAAPEFSLTGLQGETATLASLRAAGRPVMLLFTDPGCGPCNTLMSDVGDWQRRFGDRLTVAVISRRSVEDNLAKSREHRLTNVLLQEDYEVAEAYKYVGTPSAVIVDERGHIASELVGGPAAVRALVARILDEEVPAPEIEPPQPEPVPEIPTPLEIGAAAPDFELPDLDGGLVRLSAYRGRPTLVVFWDPACTFCRRTLPELRAVEEESSDKTPQMVVVSRGDREANRAMGFSAPVLLDDSFSVAASFGASGTPMAVLVDADGKVADDLGIGGEAVLALARSGAQLARN